MAPSLEQIAREYREKGFASVFLYTREAHPGENYPAHRSMEQKLAHARAFQDIFDIKRPVLVDDLAGASHRKYRLLPNMTYIVARGGKVLFKSNWTDPPTIRAVLDYFIEARARRREGLQLAPFYAEMVGYRWNDNAKLREGLARAGQQAWEDMRAVTRRNRERTTPPSDRIELDE